MTIFFKILILLLSLVALVKGSGIFVKQASAIARRYRIPEFIIGITIVAMGTSLPELIISIIAALEGNATITITNVLGSSIANIGFILAITAIFGAVYIQRESLKFDIPLSVSSVALFLLILYLSKGLITWVYGAILITFFIGYFLFRYFKLKREEQHDLIPNHTKISIPFLLLGLLLLSVGGKVCVDSAIDLANLLNISQGFIGFTILSIGSSLPELIVSVIALKKKHYGLSLGNIVGSNFFNLFLIIGISSTIMDLSFKEYLPELAILMAYNLALIVASFIGKKYYISKLEGFLLLVSYLLLLVYLFFK